MDAVTNCSERYQSCIDACNRCYQACHECSVLYLQNLDVAEKKENIDTLLKFSEICQEVSYSMSMESKSLKEIVALCANLSDECKKCAAVCRSI